MPKLHLGTIGWSYNFWKGAFLSSKDCFKELFGLLFEPV